MIFGKKINKDYWQALALMVGYIIGVGMFSLPFIVAQSGMLTFAIYIFFFGLIQYLIHLIYANMVVVNSGYHRLPGYVGLYLGKTGKNIVFLAQMLGNWGALLAYIIISGKFLYQIFNLSLGGSEFFYGSLLFFIEIIIVYAGLKMIGGAELLMTFIMLAIVALIGVKGAPAISLGNYKLMEFSKFFLPYGAMLMALDGAGAIPTVARILNKDKAKVKSVVGWSTLIATLVTVIFVSIVVGISGSNATPDAIAGIAKVLGNGALIMALFFGVLAMVTSFLGVGESLQETLNWDYKVNKGVAFAMSVFVPYIFYVAGMTDLIGVVSFAGAISGGLSSIMLLLAFIKLKEKKSLLFFKKDRLILFSHKPEKVLIYFLIGLFLIGALVEISSFF